MDKTTQESCGQADPGGTPKLVFRTGPCRGTTFVVHQDRLSIGRDAINDVVVSDDIVSSFHAAISLSTSDGEAAYWLEDVGSKNGTFVNGRRIRGSVALREGDAVCLAKAGPELVFTYGEAPLSDDGRSTATVVVDRAARAAGRERFEPSRPVGATSVRELIDRKLEDVSRRSRRQMLGMVGGATAVILIAALFLINGLFLSRHLDPVPEGAAAANLGAGRPRAVAGREAVPSASLELRVDPIYASLFRSYRDSGIGRLEVTNAGEEPLPRSRVEFELYLRRRDGELEPLLVEDFVRDVPRLPPGETWEGDLLPVLSNNILFGTDQEVTAEVRLLRGRETVARRTRGVMVYGRHVLNWQVPEQIAAFIDSEDPVVRAFVNASWGGRPEVGRGEFPPQNLVSAITVLTALTSLAEGQLRYLPDAQTPSTFTGDAVVNDRVKFPGETLREGTGDCDDLSVLCCSLLKAVGVPSVFLVGPSHVLFMFDSGLEIHQSSPFDEGTVVERDGRIWIPIEATRLAARSSSFFSAWTDAWKHHQAIVEGTMKSVDIQEAWKSYRPLQPETDAMFLEMIQSRQWVDLDALEKDVAGAIDQLRDLYQSNLESRVDELTEGLQGSEKAKAEGLYYARSGLYLAARRIFEQAVFGESPPRTREEILEREDEVSGESIDLLANLATAVTLAATSQRDYLFAAGLYEVALDHLEPALRQARGELMLRLALVHHLRGDLVEVKRWTSRAFAIDSSFEETYEDLVRGEGTVAGENDAVFRFFRKTFWG